MRLFPQPLDWLTLISDISSIAAFFVTVVIAIIGNNLRKLLRFRDYYGDLESKAAELAVLLRKTKPNHDEIRIKISEVQGMITSIPQQDRRSIRPAYERFISDIQSYQTTKTDDSAKAVLDTAFMLIQHLRQIGKGL